MPRLQNRLSRLLIAHPAPAGALLGGVFVTAVTLLAGLGGPVLALALGLGATTAVLVAALFTLFLKQRMDLAQVQAIISLQSLRFRYPLPLTSPWTISPDLAALLVEHIGRLRPRLILECGSGSSTLIMGHALRQLGAGRLISLEHIPSQAQAARRALEREGLAEVACVLDAPLLDVEVAGQTRRWYQIRDLPITPASIELLFVDGPPAPLAPHARYPALPLLSQYLAPGALILLDDGRRRAERETVARWQRENPSLSAQYLPTRKGTWILTWNPAPANWAAPPPTHP